MLFDARKGTISILRVHFLNFMEGKFASAECLKIKFYIVLHNLYIIL
jgi:hypothetical protein